MVEILKSPPLRGEDGFHELVSEDLMHFTGGMVDLIGKKCGGVHAAVVKGAPDGIAIADGDILFTAELLGGTNVSIKQAGGLSFHGRARVFGKFSAGEIGADLGIQHIGREEDCLTAALADAVKNLRKRVDVAFDVFFRVTAVVQSIANDGEIGSVAQNVSFHAGSAAARVVTRDARIDDADGYGGEEHGKNIGEISFVAVARIENIGTGAVCIFVIFKAVLRDAVSEKCDGDTAEIAVIACFLLDLF